MCACTAEQPRRLIVSNPFATLLCWISVSRFPWSVPMICSDRPTVRTNEPTYERTVCVLFHFLTHFHRQFSFRICSRVMYVFARRFDVYRRTSYEFNKNLKWKSKEKTSKWRAREPTFYFPSYLVLLSLFNRSTNTHTHARAPSVRLSFTNRERHTLYINIMYGIKSESLLMPLRWCYCLFFWQIWNSTCTYGENALISVCSCHSRHLSLALANFIENTRQ